MSADQIIVLSDDESSTPAHNVAATNYFGAARPRNPGVPSTMQDQPNHVPDPFLDQTPAFGAPGFVPPDVGRLQGLNGPRNSGETPAKRRHVSTESPAVYARSEGTPSTALVPATPVAQQASTADESYDETYEPSHDQSYYDTAQSLLGQVNRPSLPTPTASARGWEQNNAMVTYAPPNGENPRSAETVVVLSDDDDDVPYAGGGGGAGDVSSGSEQYTDAVSGGAGSNIGFFGGHSAPRRFSSGSLPSDSDAPGSRLVEDSESEEEIAILSKEEAERLGTFKKSSFDGSQTRAPAPVQTHRPGPIQPQPLYQQPQFNQPVPIHHAGAAATPEAPVVYTSQQDRAIEEFFKKYSVPQLQKYEGELDNQLLSLSQQTKAAYAEVHSMRQQSSMLSFDQTAQKEDILRRAKQKIDHAGTLVERTKKVRQYRSVLQTVKKQKEAPVTSADPRLVPYNAVVDLEADTMQGTNVNPYMTRGANEDHVHLENLFRDLYKEEKIEGMSPTPESLSISLLDHQRRGLFWLLEKEAAKLGCILADDMGLGKTVQTIAVMMANRSRDPECKTTLIVGPVSLLRQWDAEIRAKIKPEHELKVAFFHGSERRKLGTFRQMSEFDVVLTSYTTLASEFKNHFSVEFERARVSGQQNVMPQRGSGGQDYMSPFYSPNARFYRIVLDEAQYIRNKLSQASKAAACVRGTLRLCLTGTPMQNNIDELYPILRFLQARPYDNEKKFKSDISVALKSSGDNFDEYDRESSMKKLRAVLSAVMLRRTKDSRVDGKPLVQLPEKTIESVYVTMEDEEKEYYTHLETGIQKKARKLMNSAKKTGNSFLTLLLRLRQACIHQLLVEVGELNSQENSDSFHGVNWRRMHERLQQMDTRAHANVQTLSGGPGDVSANPFFGADDPMKAPDEPDEPAEAQLTCPSCLDIAGADEIVVLANCGHMICAGCISTIFGDNEEARCVTCGSGSTLQDLVEYSMYAKVFHENYDLDQLERIYGMSNTKKTSNSEKVAFLIRREEGFTPSAKMDRTLDIIKDVLTKTPDEKVIVFSHFTVTFDLMGYALKSDDVEFLRYDGTMNIDDKNKTISDFYQGSARVLLISLKAGNVGLTLTCASHVVIMDPFWNPYVEDQAMDRAHRFGQQRPVKVYRLLISGSVEDRIMDLQQRKKELIGSALDEKALRSSSHLGRRELGYLFGLNSL